MTLGLPYNAPFQDALQFYRYATNYLDISIQIPYSVPAGYSLRIKMTYCYMYQGTAYINIEGLDYTPTYDYSLGNTHLIISNMGPIVVGTTLKITLWMYINTHTSWRV